MPTTSCDRGQGAPRSARKARRPAKKATFDIDTFSHAKDLSSWAESLITNATLNLVDGSEDDLTVCREAEEQHYGENWPIKEIYGLKDCILV